MVKDVLHHELSHIHSYWCPACVDIRVPNIKLYWGELPGPKIISLLYFSISRNLCRPQCILYMFQWNLKRINVEKCVLNVFEQLSALSVERRRGVCFTVSKDWCAGDNVSCCPVTAVDHCHCSTGHTNTIPKNRAPSNNQKVLLLLLLDWQSLITLPPAGKCNYNYLNKRTRSKCLLLNEMSAENNRECTTLKQTFFFRCCINI